MKKSFLALVAFFASVNFAAAASNGVDITCPEECKLECTTSSNSIHCECVSIKDGGFCSARISTASIQIDGEETPVQNLDLVDVTASDKINNLQKVQKKAVSVRAAVKPVSQAEKNSLEPVSQGDKDLVEKYKIIWDGYEYTCPCGFVSIDDMPPKCKRGNEDKCKGVVKPVSQDR